MSTLHTVNGKPVPSLNPIILALIDSYDWMGAARTRDDAVELVSCVVSDYEQATTVLRNGLRDALALIDRLLNSRDDGWTAADVQRLAELRKLAGNG